jgi:quaternary ammonium compound-resistance protein SugE
MLSSPWVILIIAGLLEVCWSIGLKYTKGFTVLIPSAITITAMIVSMYLLSRAMHHLPLGTAYAVWVGIGIVGAAIAGIILFNEPATFARISFIILLLVSIIGLKFTA